MSEETTQRKRVWLTRGVGGIGAASFLSDLGHGVPTSLLPGLLTSTLGAPAAALGLIEGIADGAAGLARFGGGALADDPGRRRRVAVGGYSATALLERTGEEIYYLPGSSLLRTAFVERMRELCTPPR